LSDHVLKHLLVQSKISHQLLEPTILVLESPEMPDLGNAKTFELLFPALESVIGYAHPPTQLTNRRPRLHMPQGEGNLLLREP
jgi:hypothetical protein